MKKLANGDLSISPRAAGTFIGALVVAVLMGIGGIASGTRGTAHVQVLTVRVDTVIAELAGIKRAMEKHSDQHFATDLERRRRSPFRGTSPPTRRTP